jgi:phospholipid/cholesterol/gamma-HCH transport system substrate-binding protein
VCAGSYSSYGSYGTRGDWPEGIDLDLAELMLKGVQP